MPTVPAATTRVPDVAVILVNWNGLGVTTTALETLAEHTHGVSFACWVVDNGSTKDASAVELPRRFPDVRFILNPTNAGFTRANNHALRVAPGRYVLLLNSDTVQIENAVGKAVAYMDRHPDVGALGILHRNSDGGRSFQPSCFPFPNPTADVLGLIGLGRRAPPEPPVVERDADWVCGSFLMIRRACLRAVGLLDEDFFAYDEDIDWCRRAWARGWKVRFWPGAEMIHLGSVSAPHLRDKTVLMYRSHLTYLFKHHTAAALFYYLGTCARLGVALAKAAVAALRGRGAAADVRLRWWRLLKFAALRPASTFR
jgi:GT2 family glycosyltransferase